MLELKHVGYVAEDDTEILSDVSLSINERFVAITGPNGGGKYTLAKLISGIYMPTSGQILLDGIDITHMSITDRANLGVSYAFQQPVRFKGLRVRDLLRLAAGKDTTLAQACDYLSEVGLCARDYIDRELNDSLSGGELKRIEIAMVLARGTKLSVFEFYDTPISAPRQSKLYSVVKEQELFSYRSRDFPTFGDIIILFSIASQKFIAYGDL